MFTPKSDGWSSIVSAIERSFDEYGVSPKGLGWPNAADLEARFATLLSIVDGAPAEPRPVVLDVGCGPGLLLDYLLATRRLDAVEYHGVDLSAMMVQAAQLRWPSEDFATRDIVAEPVPDQSVDFVIMNGVLNVKLELPQDAMVGMAQALILAAFKAARVGVAFNVMSRHVDWERPDLFHWGFDELAAFLKARVSRHYAFRADYGLYEYAAFVWREPRRPPAVTNAWWER